MKIGGFKGILLSALMITSIVALAIPLLSAGTVHTTLTAHAPISIFGNAGFTAANGVTSGSGTQSNPYIIQGWAINTPSNVNGIWIGSTTAYFVIRNCVVENSLHGIDLNSVVNGMIENNIVGGSAFWYGIGLDVSSDNNIISCNTVENSLMGIYIFSSSNNLILNNTTKSNRDGIVFEYSGNNLVSSNISVNNGFGIYFYMSDNNRIYHNRFITNGTQTHDDSSNYWDNGYPSGGNYWSDYAGADHYHGQNQNIPGPDGIGDTPYNISGGNQDHYPLMNPVVAQQYTVTFTESGLPTGYRWWVDLYGDNQPSTGNAISFSEPNGWYTYSTGASGYTASPASNGLINVEGDTNVNIAWGNIQYYVDIHENGLPLNESWSVTCDNITQTSTSDTISFTFHNNGTYHLSASGLGYTPEPSNFDVNIASGGTSTNVIFIPNSNPIYFTSWDPVENSYYGKNFTNVWSGNGFCYGLASTALLYFMHYSMGDDSYPYFPLQYPLATSTSELDLSGINNYNSPTLNNASLALTFHQLYDTNNTPPYITIKWNEIDDENQQFNNLLENLKLGYPAVLAIGDITGPKHSVVAWGAGKIEDGTWEIAVYDPNHPETTQVAIYDPSSRNFSYTATGPYSNFIIVDSSAIKAYLDSPLDDFSSLFGHWSGGITNYDIVIADENVKIISPSLNYLTSGTIITNENYDYFKEWGNSQTFVCDIPGTSGVEEGNAQVYAIPSYISYSVDPDSNQSDILIIHVDNESGQLVEYGYLENATATQGPLSYTVTPSSSGLSISTGTNAIGSNVTFFYCTEQENSLFQTSNVQIDAMRTANFTVTNWQTLDNTTVTLIITPILGVSISPSSQIGYNGETLAYTTTVTNTENVSDNFILMVIDNDNWGPIVSPTSLLNMSPGENRTATLSVTVPSNAKGGTSDAIVVIAESQTDNTVSGSDSCTASPVSRDIQLFTGWNLVGFPLIYENMTPDNIFTGLTYYSDYLIYWWTAPGGPYSLVGPDDVLQDNISYWVYTSTSKTVMTTGTKSDNRNTDCVTGWNMVGFPVVDNTTTPNNIFAPLNYYDNYIIYYWNAPGGPYGLQDPDTALLDNTGYWVYIDENMMVTVP